jgi:hypothetical protein
MLSRKIGRILNIIWKWLHLFEIVVSMLALKRKSSFGELVIYKDTLEDIGSGRICILGRSSLMDDIEVFQGGIYMYCDK